MDLHSHLKLLMSKSVISPWWSNNNCSQPYLSKATLCTRDDRGIPEKKDRLQECTTCRCCRSPIGAVVMQLTGDYSPVLETDTD